MAKDQQDDKQEKKAPKAAAGFVKIPKQRRSNMGARSTGR